MSKEKKGIDVVVVGCHDHGKTITHKLIEDGQDRGIIIVDTKEKVNPFEKPPLPFTRPYLDDLPNEVKSGKESRRERRKQDRKKKKK